MMENRSRGKDIIRNTLKVAGVVGALVAAYRLYNSSIFRGKHFLTEGLTEKQIKGMDSHNILHNVASMVEDQGEKLIALAEGTGFEATTIAEQGSIRLAQKRILNTSVEDLPPNLVHTH